MPAQRDLVRQLSVNDESVSITNELTNDNIPQVMATDIRVYQNQLQVRIANHHVWALVDSGANISVMSKELADKIRPLCPSPESPDFTLVKGVGGEVHQVTEKLTVEFWINSIWVKQVFHVINGHHSVILGVDFLQAHSAVVDFGSNQLHIRGTKVKLSHPAIRSCLARTTDKVQIPARSEVTIPVKCSKEYCNTVLLLNPTTQSESHNVTVTPTVVYVSGSKSMCRVVNNTFDVIALPSHFTLAYAHTVTESDLSSVCQLETTSDTDLGQEGDISFEVNNPDVSKGEKAELLQFLTQNRQVFAKDKSELKQSSIVTHVIDTQNSLPAVQRFYRTSPEKRAEIDRQIEENLSLGLIEPSTSEWRAPVVLVKKADNSWRLCCDYRKLNAITRPQSFPLPRLEDVWDAIGEQEATIFSTLDLSNGFHQLQMDPDSVHKTAFVTQNGQYQWRVLPYGLRNSPVTFMKAMHEVLRKHLFKSCIVYVDDIIVYSRNMTEHLEHLKEIFSCILKAGLKLKPSKCKFAAAQVKYLGHILSQDGVRPNPEKTTIIDNFPAPRNVKQVRSFIGLTNYYKRFIKDYSKIAAPLFALLRKDVPFVWSTQCQQTFDYLKKQLVQEPILKYPDMHKHFYLTTDASNTGIGYVLSQKDEAGREYAVAYGGRALHGPETRYSTSELEYLAIKEGIHAYHPYLADKEFTVYTDHKPLKYAESFRPDGGRLGRWALFLQNYNFKTEYKPGKTNLNADTLSRIPFPELEQIKDSQDRDHPSITLCSIDPPDMAEMQRQCPDVQPFYKFHRENVLPNNRRLANLICRTQDQFVVDEDGLLYHISYPGNRRKPELMIKQLVLPRTQRHAIITSHHDNLMGGGHQGIDRTYAAITLRAYWPGMYKTIQEYVKSCETCQKVKHKNRNPVPLTPMPIVPVLERWHMDFLCMKTTPDGYKYILLLVDSFSRWCEAFPTKSQDSQTVAKILYQEIFTRYGTPREIVSDLGRQFTSKLVRAVCELGGSKQKFTSPYHPQTNAACERMNSYIIQSVKAYCGEDQDDWPDKLPGILMAYRSTPATRSTELSPFQLMFGRTMVTPSDIDLLPRKSLPETYQGHLNGLIQNLKVFQQVAKSNVQKNQAKYKAVHDRNAKERNLLVGNKVLMTNPAVPVGLVPKLFPPYKGPYTILEKGPNNTYRLEDSSGKVLPRLIHANRLSAFVERQTHAENDPEVAQPNDLTSDTDDSVNDHAPEKVAEIRDQTKPGSNLDAPTSDDEDQPDNFPPITDDSPVTQDQVLPPQLSQGEVPRTNTQPQRVVTHNHKSR